MKRILILVVTCLISASAIAANTPAKKATCSHRQDILKKFTEGAEWNLERPGCLLDYLTTESFKSLANQGFCLNSFGGIDLAQNAEVFFMVGYTRGFNETFSCQKKAKAKAVPAPAPVTQPAPRDDRPLYDE